MTAKNHHKTVREIERIEQEIDKNQTKRKHIVERLLALEKEKTVYNECIDLFTIYQYNDMAYKKDLNTFDKGRFLVLRAIMKMIQYDKKYGLPQKNMSDEDKDCWEDINNDLREGGHILYRVHGLESMYDDRLWDYIPKKLENYIRAQFGRVV